MRIAAQAEQLDREGAPLPVLPGGGQAGGQFLAGGAGLGQAGQVALDVGQEDRDALVGQALGEQLEGAGLTGAGGACDQGVTVEQAQRDADVQPRHGGGIVPGEGVQVDAHRQGGGGKAVAGADLGGVGRVLSVVRRRGLGGARGESGIQSGLGGGRLGCGGLGGGLRGFGLETCDRSSISHDVMVDAERGRAGMLRAAGSFPQAGRWGGGFHREIGTVVVVVLVNGDWRPGPVIALLPCVVGVDSGE